MCIKTRGISGEHRCDPNDKMFSCLRRDENGTLEVYICRECGKEFLIPVSELDNIDIGD